MALGSVLPKLISRQVLGSTLFGAKLSARYALGIPVILFLCGIQSYCLAAADAAFIAPLPPPELGSKLTDFRTEQQQAEARIRDVAAQKDMGNNNSRSGRITTGSANAPKGGASSRMQAAPQNKDLLNDISHTYTYVANKRIILSRNGEAIIRFKNTAGQTLSGISRVLIGSGFKAEVRGDSIVVWPTGLNNHSKLAVTLKGRSCPFVFELNYYASRFDERTTENVVIKD